MLTLSAQMMMVGAWPEGERVTPFGNVPLGAIAAYTGHGVKRGVGVEAALTDSPLPVTLKFLEHKSFSVHAHYLKVVFSSQFGPFSTTPRPHQHQHQV